MSTTAQILAGCVAIAMVLTVDVAKAGEPNGMAAAWAAATTVGQAGLFNPFSAGAAKPAPSDPFQGHNAPSDAGVARVAQDAQGASPSPGTPSMGRPDATAGGSSPFGRPLSMVPPTQSDMHLPPALANQYSGMAPDGRNLNRARSDALLKLARGALAVGDLRRAANLVMQARQFQIQYAPTDDNPERIEAAITKYREVDGLDKTTEDYRRAYARMLMEQAEALLRWNDLQQAEELANQAARQRVVYGPYEAKPDDLLGRIAAMRRQPRPLTPISPQDAPLAQVPQQAPVDLMSAKQEVARLLQMSRQALAAGQVEQADSFARQADQMRLPDNAFGPTEDSPTRALQDIGVARSRYPSGVVQAGGFIQDNNNTAMNAVYDPSRDPTRNMQAAGQAAEPVPTPPGTPLTATPGDGASAGQALFQQGEAALKAHDRDKAYELFRQAAQYMGELDALTAQRLQDHLQLLSMPRNAAGRPNSAALPGTPADEMAARQKALLNQVLADVGHREADARAMSQKDPKMAMSMLQETRKKVEGAGLEPSYRDQLLRRLDRSIGDLQKYIDQNSSQINLAERNNTVRKDMTREEEYHRQTQAKLVELIDKYNRLMDEERYPEAEVIAKQAAELAPKDPIVEQLKLRVKLATAIHNNTVVKEAQEDGFLSALGAVDKAAIPSAEDISFPDAKDWQTLVKRRQRFALGLQQHRSERDMEIEKKLKLPVSFSFHNKPLSQAIEQLGKLADVTIHLDEEGLKQEGVSPETPVNLDVTHEIMLRSALNLLLDGHRLCFVIKDEVLKITSEDKKAGQLIKHVYPVGDLVMPIPNFVPGRMGLESAYHNAMSNAGVGGIGAFGSASAPMAVVANKEGKSNNAMINPALLANLAGRQPNVGGPVGGGGGGPGGVNGGTGADFESLIELLTQTISPKSWDHAGGAGTVAPYETNLSLVVSQTQEVHEEIVDLLEQLRRMQDLQVTIEVRFITLADNFFERMGVDFDFNIRSSQDPIAAGFGAPVANAAGGAPAPVRVGNNGVAIAGLQGISGPSGGPAQAQALTTTLDVPFTQGSYALSVPQFGGFDAGAGASLGFAILSDIEAYFFINAAQGDRRTNVLQAPKVTLFNGQQAFVSDTSQTPFVISLIPVVGDFAAAQQPVIVVLNEGTFMTVQAVVSNDRRFVRLTIVPFFSKIDKVDTFQFQGSSTTTTDTTQNGIVDQANGIFNNNRNRSTTTSSGTTVQLPTFSFVTVTTTVSVPDGGTVLLGGIKRLSEGRNEFGVPILDKIPYINRLFKNTGIGRDTSSLMMMVTPRIIIQEEEEEKMGIQSTP